MSTSYEIVERVRREISNEFVTASDTVVAKALDVSRAAISAYKHDRDVMSIETFGHADAILKLPPMEAAELGFALLAQSKRKELNPKVAHYFEKISDWFEQTAKASKRGKTIVPALLLLAIAAHGSKSLAGSVDESTLYADQSIHYANWRRRDRRSIARRLWALISPIWDVGRMEPLKLSPA